MENEKSAPCHFVNSTFCQPAILNEGEEAKLVGECLGFQLVKGVRAKQDDSCTEG
jgi:hypothetical protein